MPGDRLTRLHWPAAARTGDLLVRDFAEPAPPSVAVLVDDRPLLLEESVALAAADALAALDAGAAVEILTASGGRVRVAPGPSARTELLEALAVVAPARRTSW